MGKEGNKKLHGKSKKKSPVVLLIIDMISDFKFPEANKIFRRAIKTASKIAKLAKKMRTNGHPVIFANDNFGKWESNLPAILAHCRKDKRGKKLLKILHPLPSDYFIVKPKHSAFFATPLEVILRTMKTVKLVITGMTGTQCVLFTTNDAVMRDFETYVPKDCIVCIDEKEQREALSHFQKFETVNSTPSPSLFRVLSQLNF